MLVLRVDPVLGQTSLSVGVFEVYVRGVEGERGTRGHAPHPSTDDDEAHVAGAHAVDRGAKAHFDRCIEAPKSGEEVCA